MKISGLDFRVKFAEKCMENTHPDISSLEKRDNDCRAFAACVLFPEVGMEKILLSL